MSMIECRSIYGYKKLVPKEKLVLRPGVYGIIINGRKILLVRSRSTGKYALPGGGVDVGERIEDALKREVREETGIEIEVGDFVHFEEDFFYYDPKDEAFHGLLFFYTCTPSTFDLADDDQVDDDEVEKPRWVDLHDLEESDVYQGQRHVLFKILRLEPS